MAKKPVKSEENSETKQKETELKPTEIEPKDTKVFPIVGIGASAGGLEAIQELLKNLPIKTGMAFVYVQHLASGQESLLTEILTRSTKMPVSKAADQMLVEPNNLYVMTPDVYLTISDGILHLRPKIQKFDHPIDEFLISLGEDKKNLAIGVLLSGSGSDGTEGIKAIYGEGGITFAESEKTAKYSNMPASAIESGTVNFVLTPKQIAEELVRIEHHPHLIPPKPGAEEVEPTGGEDGIRNILALMKLTFGVDFNSYKITTVSRRISRRMAIQKIENIPDYLKFIRGNGAELQALFDDMLIAVTSFFREPETFKELSEKVFPALMKDRPSGTPIRVWVPGCSTGEEAYSIAMLLREYMEKQASYSSINVFGTDLSQKNIDKARSGIYPESISAEVPRELLTRFFLKTAKGYQVNKVIRDICIFAKQDLTHDPPFSNLDIISCRNVLIYLKPAMQKNIIPLLHYALKPKGFLVLGRSESIGAFNDLFSMLDGKGPIYSKRLVPSNVPVKVQPLLELKLREKAVIESAEKPAVALQKEFERGLLDRYAPDSVFINGDMELLFVHGNIGHYLNPAQGVVSLNLIRMAREELRPELQTAILKAKQEKTVVRRERVCFASNGQQKEVNIEIIPTNARQTEETFYSILFEEPKTVPISKEEKGSEAKRKRKDEMNNVIETLQQDLTSTRNTLQTTIEQQEATNEELQSALEEVQSTNEEMQSTNEELETSKEELQSTNEELNTLNAELTNRNQDLTRALTDQSNIFGSINVALIMTDVNLKIRLFTPLAEGMFNLIPADVGRSIKSIRLRINVQDIEKTLQEVVQKQVAKEQEVQDDAGRWYLMRVKPYLSEEKKVDGAVLSFIDIDSIVHGKIDLEKSYGFSQTVLGTMAEPLTVLDSELNVVSANPAFYTTFQIQQQEIVGKPIYNLPVRPWSDAQFRRRLKDVFLNDKTVDKFVIDQEFPGLGLRHFLLNARPLKFRSEKTENVLVTMEDVTDLRQREAELKSHADNLEQLVEERTKKLQDAQRLSTIGETAAMVGHDIRNPLQAITSDVYLARSDLDSIPDGEAKDGIKDSLEGIQNNIDYVNKIVQDLQDYARPLKADVQEIDLEDLCKEVVFNDGVPKSIAASCKVDGKPKIMTDPAMLKRILINLVTNSVQAMPNGGKLDVSACEEKGEIVLTVKDTGVGISEDIKPKLFTPLMTNKSKGQGFGLAVVKRMTETLGGTVTFESEVGKGATFIIRLPQKS